MSYNDFADVHNRAIESAATLIEFAALCRTKETLPELVERIRNLKLKMEEPATVPGVVSGEVAKNAL